MKSASSYVVVWVTAPDLEVARRLGRLAVESSLAACANLVPGLESHYRWKGKLEQSAEVLIVFKTTRKRLRKLEALIVAEHPYETPEFIALPLLAGQERYLNWIRDSVKV